MEIVFVSAAHILKEMEIITYVQFSTEIRLLKFQEIKNMAFMTHAISH